MGMKTAWSAQGRDGKVGKDSSWGPWESVGRRGFAQRVGEKKKCKPLPPKCVCVGVLFSLFLHPAASPATPLSTLNLKNRLRAWIG